MQFALLTAASLVAMAAAVSPAVDAGGPQSPPPSTSAYLTAGPTVATVVTVGNSSSVAPLPTSTGTVLSRPSPIINSTSAGSSASSNLSTTAGGGSKYSTQSVVLITTTGPEGKPTTRTEIVGVAPSTTTGPSPSASPTGSTQPGAGSAIRGGAVAALAALAGVGAAFL